MTMIGLGIVTSIGQDGADAHSLKRAVQQRHEAIDIDPWPTPRQGPDDEVSGAVDDRFELAETGLRGGLPEASLAGPTAHRVGTDVPALKAG